MVHTVHDQAFQVVNTKFLTAFETLFRVNPKGKNPNVALVCHQHILPSLIPLFQYIADQKVVAGNIFVLGKPYSTVESAFKSLGDI